MGKIEKLVVLAVLFVSAIVVAVSWHGSTDETLPQRPFGEVAAGETKSSPETPERTSDGRSWIQDEVWDERAPNKVSTTRRSQPDGNSSGGDAPSQADLLLSASPEGAGQSTAQVPDPIAAPLFDAEGRPRILLATADVEELGVDSHRAYTVRAGDTWTSLSKRLFIGGTKHRQLLQRQNETVTVLELGALIAVPVYDTLARDESRRPFEARPVRSAEEHGGAGIEGAPKGADSFVRESSAREGSVREGVASGDGWYTVTSGDTLSGISTKVYGTSTRWREIYEANQTRLDGPDWLDVGTRLRLP